MSYVPKTEVPYLPEGTMVRVKHSLSAWEMNVDLDGVVANKEGDTDRHLEAKRSEITIPKGSLVMSASTPQRLSEVSPYSSFAVFTIVWDERVLNLTFSIPCFEKSFEVVRDA